MFKTYFEISLGVSIVILLNYFLTPLFNKHYSLRLRYAVWILCAVILLIPVRLHSNVKIDLPQPEYVQTSSDTVNTADTVSDTVSHSVQTPANIPPQNQESSRNNIFFNVSDVLNYIWYLGIIIFSLHYLSGYIMFKRKIKPWCRRISAEGYNQRPQLMMCPLIKTPILIGLIKPQIILPEKDYTQDEINIIIQHELTHYKRHDLWFKLLFAAANAVHWFNPVIYFFRSLANRDMEYSCDELVIKNKDMSFRRSYSMVILNCAGSGINTDFSTYFSCSKQNLKRRFSNILNSRKKRGVLICILLALMAVAFAGIFAFPSPESNYLFIGRDERNNIDTIMVADITDEGIYVTSIPRSTVNIAPYTESSSDSNAIADCIPQLMGISTDKYLSADTGSVLNLLSQLGNVDFEIPDIYNDGVGMVYDDPAQNLHINLPPGLHSLSSSQILDVFRYRKGNIQENGMYNGYEADDIDRIKMTHSLLNTIFEQKKDILSDKSIINAAYEFLSQADTNMNTSDIDNICKALQNGKISFNILPGEYGRDTNNRIYYMPQSIVSDTDFLPTVQENNSLYNVIYADDTVHLSCTLESLSINGEEQIETSDQNIGIWYNSRLETLHTCILLTATDGSKISIQPYETIYFDGNIAHGTFKITNSQDLKEVFSGTITGLDTPYPLLHSDDGKYAAQLAVKSL